MGPRSVSFFARPLPVLNITALMHKPPVVTLQQGAPPGHIGGAVQAIAWPVPAGARAPGTPCRMDLRRFDVLVERTGQIEERLALVWF
jgi:hypothetical protein